MKNTFKILGIIAVVAVIGLSTVGCAAAPSPAATPVAVYHALSRVGWSEYTVIPSKDYVVVGTIVLRDVSRASVLADLMERAVAMGGHDIINVRLTSEATSGRRWQWISAATAVVIRYTNETLFDTPERWHVDIGTAPAPGGGTAEAARGGLFGR